MDIKDVQEREISKSPWFGSSRRGGSTASSVDQVLGLDELETELRAATARNSTRDGGSNGSKGEPHEVLLRGKAGGYIHQEF